MLLKLARTVVKRRLVSEYHYIIYLYILHLGKILLVYLSTNMFHCHYFRYCKALGTHNLFLVE
jgi:hypothetical protein